METHYGSHSKCYGTPGELEVRAESGSHRDGSYAYVMSNARRCLGSVSGRCMNTDVTLYTSDDGLLAAGVYELECVMKEVAKWMKSSRG